MANKGILNQNDAIQILYLAKTTEILKLVYKNDAATKFEIMQPLLNHPALSADFLLTILNNRLFTDEVLLSILKHPSAISLEVLKAIAEKKQIGCEVYFAIIAHPLANIGLMKTVFAVDGVLSFIQQQKITPTFAFKMLPLLDRSKNLASALPIFEMITLANETELGWLLNFVRKGQFPREAFILLAQRCQSKAAFVQLCAQERILACLGCKRC